MTFLISTLIICNALAYGGRILLCLKVKQKRNILQHGLRHYTSEDSAISICESRVIYSRSQPRTFFFENIKTPVGAYQYNIDLHNTPKSPKTHVVTITNIQESQLQGFSSSIADDILSVKGNFVLLPENVIEYHEIDMKSDIDFKYTREHYRYVFCHHMIIPVSICVFLLIVLLKETVFVQLLKGT
jgi:hypothetical protein